MRPPGFPPGYIFDVVNLELASDGCAPLENGDTNKLVDNDDFDSYSNAWWQAERFDQEHKTHSAYDAPKLKTR